ncbi:MULTISPECIES: glutamate-1-semialdehyde 2,1-aminomutase [Brevibacillus]|jgi:glutamate-1-semialdehyde 2,1-aminomutase|uniref:glutamate-1-semialdehyde 2,1-aminomutase n=1 Tax=Brevibacillus TaxID=55080 RepID=UPI000F08D060|nr:glutamate-1-semialdehyde 2,1-aminomutase [Brevibacillus borstelensis]MBE5397195.1 glutamate-1-semialdehyde 2,1-aminomutase [Brevibacillus borstelensis]MED1743550.1 glutamate-1-semialdehyde 2,1-aminomutase [Brevibacillus borstelensis]MED1874783.1 glutamate-1-semialdehyde 2,1-aminomutase [Brevibacillus borstelensis]MED1884704.1 glutamate-1-semialdehyde 2,1-aminomutase [Brevibacillus borstelensis]MED2007317.1 glutamate-1-semialdehyde 2,1-aminomutase [Brevibacillus borstelensis]
MKMDNSSRMFEEAQRYIPGGVNSPVRAFKSVGGNPVYIAKGEGSRITDVDGNSYIDFIGSWGPLILGHAHPKVLAAIQEAAVLGTSFGAPTERETEMAKLVCEIVPSVEVVRMVNSGTEATMSALRLARGYTKRNKIMKFEGCYHGHADSLLIKAGSGVATLGLPDSPGVPEATAVNTITVPYNDLESVKLAFENFGADLAAVIVEPIAGNMGVVPPQPGFLEALREITQQHGTLLIFDEVMTGFRVSRGGAQELYGITPDLTTMGKVIGGGLPVGAYGGKREIMQQIAPAGPIYQAGTLSGNPLAMAAGLTTLQELGQPGAYEKLEALSARLAEGLAENARKLGIPHTLNRVGSMVCLFFTDTPVVNYDTAKTADLDKFSAYFRYLLEEGVMIPPSQFEGMFVSLAHTEEDIERTIDASYKAMKRL